MYKDILQLPPPLLLNLMMKTLLLEFPKSISSINQNIFYTHSDQGY